jgi:hypothetical protein
MSTRPFLILRRPSSRRSRLPALRRGREALVGAVAAIAVGAAAVILRRRRQQDQESRRPWRCECGQAYLVHGMDRHRVYWLPEAPESDPLLERECVQCGATLPAGHDTALLGAGR